MSQTKNSFDPRRHALPAALTIALAAMCGCVLQRGVDFGHWAQSGEKIPLARFVEPRGTPPFPTPVTKMVLLPIIGNMEPGYLNMLDTHIMQEARLYFQAPLITVERDGKLGEYVNQANLLPLGDVWNTQEAARLGQLVGVTHVLCSRVRSWQQHPPQQLIMDFALVETAFGATIFEMTAAFDAREQQVLLALDRYLRNRSSRQYNRQNLDIILRSPREYSGFAVSLSMQVMAEKIWNPDKLLKPGRSPADNVGK